MNNATHAPEPWSVARVGYGGFRDIKDSGGAAVARCFDERAQHQRPTPETASAGARRIVACVNALAGLNPEAVAGVVEFLERLAYADGHGPVDDSWDNPSDSLAARSSLAALRGKP